MFITAFTRVRKLFLPLARSIQSSPPSYSFLKIRFNIIVPTTPRFSSCLIPSGFPTKTLQAILLSHKRAT